MKRADYHRHMDRKERELKIMLSIGIGASMSLCYMSAAFNMPALNDAGAAVGLLVNLRWVWS